tara:strand:+ start:509 stop:1099 length:591 start_codon:yes stop_codon:yes gene_type:complete
MLNKTFLQLFLLVIVIIIPIFFFKSYFIKEKKSDISKNIENIDEQKILDKKKSNLIYNIEYVSEFKNGNYYIISSEYGELIYDQPELIKMKKVTAIINLSNSNPIKISAENATYNNTNNNTSFEENVLMSYNEHSTNSDNLDLIFEKNLATLSNNIVYKNVNTKLLADKMEIDLITKNSKIFMNNNSDTVKIVSIN